MSAGSAEYAVLEQGSYDDKVCWTCRRLGCTWLLYTEAGPLPDLTYIRSERYFCSDCEAEATKRKALIDSQGQRGR